MENNTELQNVTVTVWVDKDNYANAIKILKSIDIYGIAEGPVITETECNYFEMKEVRGFFQINIPLILFTKLQVKVVESENQ